MSHSLFLICFFIISICSLVRGEEEKKSVLIVGGGVSGLTAAHELSSRQFDVKVFERQDVLGGKARSYPTDPKGIPNAHETGHHRLPGEHGFRIFWNYYQHVFDTLKRIPYNNKLTVYHHMNELSNNILLSDEGEDIYMNFGPKSFKDLVNEIRNLTTEMHSLSKEEMDFGLERVKILFTTCDARMTEEFEKFSFGDFIGLPYRSANFTKYFLNLFHLGGFAPDMASLSSTANYVQMLNSPWDDNMAIRSLKGPTNEAWIDPWTNFLSSKYGAQFLVNYTSQSFTCSEGKVTSIQFEDTYTGQKEIANADYYIFAVPADQMIKILANSPSCSNSLVSLQGLKKINFSWMAGMQFYLHEDIQITNGFSLYLDSPWKVSSVSFNQWWPDYTWNDKGDGKERGILSAIVSNFTTPGILFNKSAMFCNDDEIQQEVWAQMKRALNKNKEILKDSNLAGFSLDTSLSYADGKLSNKEWMFYATPNSWNFSPASKTEISNLFLAGDYVKADTRVTPSSMEAANESARRAVNEILIASHSKQPSVRIFKPPRNIDFLVQREFDCARYKKGLPHSGCTQKGCVVNA